MEQAGYNQLTESNGQEHIFENIDRLNYEIDEIKFKVERILMHQLELSRRIIGLESQKGIKSLNDTIISDISGLISRTDTAFNRIINKTNLI